MSAIPTSWTHQRPTKHAALFLHQRAEVAEDLVKLVNAALNLPNFSLPLLNHRLLEREFLRRKLGLQNLGLTLRGRWT